MSFATIFYQINSRLGIIYLFIKIKWGVKKCEAKKNQQLKALISNKAKKSVNESAT